MWAIGAARALKMLKNAIAAELMPTSQNGFVRIGERFHAYRAIGGFNRFIAHNNQ